MWEKIGVETEIDFVDTFNGSSYVFINDPTRLQTLVSMWNDWVSRYESYSSPLTVLSADPGVNVLNSLNQTRYWANVSAISAERNEDVRDTRVEQRRDLSGTPYASRQAFAISFREAPFAATAAITTMWILPTLTIQTGTDTTNTCTFTQAQEMYNEQYSIASSTTGDQGATMASILSTYAAAMTHSKSTTSALDQAFINLSNSGRAGILSSLAASFLGHAFGPTVGTIASSVANVLPI